MRKKVGIYSGTFDPVHEGHLAFATQALTESKLDKVFFLVEPRPRRKQGVRALVHREAMVRLAVADNAKFGIIQLQQINFSVEETLPTLRSLFEGAELHFLMGEDVFSKLNTWPHINDLLSSSSFIVGIRKHDISAAQANLKQLQKTRGLKFGVAFIETEKQDISSSKIRLALKRGNQPHGLLTSIKGYITDAGLYTNEE